jgi:hypothetical protein
LKPNPARLDASEWLFSYGTLQDPAVQRANFGRELTGHPDRLVGYSLSLIAIRDPSVVATSGMEHHKIIEPSSKIGDEVAGTVYQLTSEELAAADRYEVSEYKRAAVTMKSGLKAWAYIRA